MGFSIGGFGVRGKKRRKILKNLRILRIT